MRHELNVYGVEPINLKDYMDHHKRVTYHSGPETGFVRTPLAFFKILHPEPIACDVVPQTTLGMMHMGILQNRDMEW